MAEDQEKVVPQAAPTTEGGNGQVSQDSESEGALADRVDALSAENISPHEVIEIESKRLASEIAAAREKSKAQGSTEKPDVEVAYDYAMKINLLRSLEAARSGEGTSKEWRSEQIRQRDLEGLKKAQVDALAEYFTTVVDRGENFKTIATSVNGDIAEIGGKVNLWRVDESVKAELSKADSGQPYIPYDEKAIPLELPHKPETPTVTEPQKPPELPEAPSFSEDAVRTSVKPSAPPLPADPFAPSK